MITDAELPALAAEIQALKRNPRLCLLAWIDDGFPDEPNPREHWVVAENILLMRTVLRTLNPGQRDTLRGLLKDQQQ